MRIRSIPVVGGLGLAALLLGAAVYFLYFADFALSETPSLARTLTPNTKPAPLEMGSYDLLGRTIGKDEATTLLASETGRRRLAPENGAVPITPALVALGRRAFYEETYGNEIFMTEVVGVLDGPINPGSLLRAILSLRGRPTTNLQIRLDEDVTVGGRAFRQGTWVNTGLDVPQGGRMPLGMRVFVKQGRLRVGMTCAACHAAVDPATGLVIEGAPNADVNAGLLLAFATNSAAFFRQTDVNPLSFPAGPRTFRTADGRRERLPEPQAVEDAVDAALLAWPPGSFDSTGDLRNNPSQIPTSYTFDAWPYGWNGFANLGWFHGLTTLNANVHGTNSDMTTGADGSEPLLGIPKDVYLGVLLQRAAHPRFRPPPDESPARFLERNDPTPGAPSLNWAVMMPGYPMGSPFILDGLMPARPGLPAGAQLNGLSAFQNTLAPPPRESEDPEAVRRGAAVFARAGCGGCHSGPRFTNHRVLPQPEIGTQGSRAGALAALGWGVTIISLGVIAIVAGLLGAGLLRRRPGIRDASGFPAVSRDPGGIRWIYLGVGISTLVLFGSTLWTFATFASVAKRAPEPELTVAVTGHQWWWEVRYEGGDAAGGFSTANEIHIPTGRPVRLRLDSADVIHSFWVPKLAGKTDAIPGQTNLAWLQADAPGVFLGHCAEYCGLQHAHMALQVVAEAPEDFRTWRDGQMKTAEAAPPPAPEPAPPDLRAGQADFVTRCGLCHTVRGTAARGMLGPDLTHLMSRHRIAAGLLPNTIGNLGGWVANAQALKPGCFMPAMDLPGPELLAILGYLQTLR